MRALIQRVKWARVRVTEEIVGEIGPGLLIFLGVGKGDGEGELELLTKKCAQLRIFEDEDGKMNRSVQESGGECLVVSQFTLYGSCRKGRRPSFTAAESPELASSMCDRFAALLRLMGIGVGTGRFGAMMEVELLNDGPVTIWLDSDELQATRRGRAQPS